MKNLLRFEIYKAKRSKMVLVLGILVLAFTALIALFGDEYGAYGLRTTINMGFILLLFSTLLTCSFIVPDYRMGIMRNLVMSGKPRYQIYLSKVIVSLVASLAMFFVIFAILTVIYSFSNGWGNVNAGEYLVVLFLAVLQLSAFVTLTLFWANLTKSTGGAIGISLGWMFLFLFINLMGIGATNSTSRMKRAIGEFLVEVGNSHPVFLFFQPTYRVYYDLPTADIIKYTIMGVVYLTATILFGILVFRKKDLK